MASNTDSQPAAPAPVAGEVVQLPEGAPPHWGDAMSELEAAAPAELRPLIFNVAYACDQRLSFLSMQVRELEVRAALAQDRASQAGAAGGVMAEIDRELQRAVAKFPAWPTDPLHASGVVMEESGELAKAVLQAVYEPHKSTQADVRAEAIQTAAMAIRFVQSLDADAYKWTPGEQHSQTAAPIRTSRRRTTSTLTSTAAPMASRPATGITTT